MIKLRIITKQIRNMETIKMSPTGKWIHKLWSYLYYEIFNKKKAASNDVY